MQLRPEIVSAIAIGAAAISILLTAAAFLLFRRHEASVAAKREAAMAPIAREKKDRAYYVRRGWMKDFDEYSLHVGDASQLSERLVGRVLHSIDGKNFHFLFCIPTSDSPRTESTAVDGSHGPAPHDLSAALSHFFENKLDLGIDPRAVQRMLSSTERLVRTAATDFLLNKVALAFCNFGSDPQYSLLPPRLLELAEDIKVRGFEALDNFEDKGYEPLNENRFLELYNRWRILTFKIYGTKRMPSETQQSVDRRVEFLLTVLGPFIWPEALKDARLTLQEKMMCSHEAALFCASQKGHFVHSWDFIGSTSKVVYVGEPERIPPFDMMAEKSLVVHPAWLLASSEDHGLPFVNAYCEVPAKVILFTDEKWATFVKD